MIVDALPSGGGTPGGSDTQVQFNNAGAFGGAAGVTFAGTGRLALAAGTVTADAPLLNASQTWNNAGATFAGWRLNVTDSSSAAGSMLLDLQVGGASRFSVRKDGAILPSSVTADQSISVNTSTNSLIFLGKFSGAEGLIGTNGQIGFYGGGSFPGVLDVILARQAANTLAQRNGTNAQTHRINGTHTDASNGRWLELGMTAAGVARILPTGNGTGASGNVLHISGLPTSNPGPGILWNDAGTVKVGT